MLRYRDSADPPMRGISSASKRALQEREEQGFINNTTPTLGRADEE